MRGQLHRDLDVSPRKLLLTEFEGMSIITGEKSCIEGTFFAGETLKLGKLA